MSKELESNMRLKKQTSLKRLSLKKKDSANTKPSKIFILLMFIAIAQVPISLKASFDLVCFFSESSSTNKTLFFCDD